MERGKGWRLIISRRLRVRSTSMPADSEKSRNGSQVRTVMSETWKVLARSVVVARKGIVIPDIRVPAALTV